jgi:hypothetical protein
MLNAASFTSERPEWANWAVVTIEGNFVAWAKNSKHVCKIVDAGVDLHWVKLSKVRA